MSAKSAKGKGKSRGGSMSASQRRSRSRNTTPASVSGFSADTFLSHEGGLAGGPTYQELITAHGTTDPTSIPSSASLADLRNGLRTMQETVKARSLACERRLRELHNKIELDRPEAQNDPETERLRRGLDDIDRKDKLVKRTKKQKDADNKRPPAVGAHQATGQGMANDTVAQREKRKVKMESPELKRAASSPPAEEDLEQQPPPAPPYVVFEPFDDDPSIYEIPTVAPDAPYEEKARAYSVARFPEDDLSSLIPGDPPDEDLSKAKPTNQVAINTFATYIEPFFRPFTEEDIAFLRERGDRATPFLTPKLGRHYSEVWAEEDGITPSYATPVPPAHPLSNRAVSEPHGSPADICEEVLDTEDVSLGPLHARVLSAFFPEDDDSCDLPPPSTADNTPTPAPTAPRAFATTIPSAPEASWKTTTQKADYNTMEERIRQEIVYCGLLEPSQVPNFDTSEDDEVSARLRMLQTELREQMIKNGARKTRIQEHLKEHMAYQEYQTILDDLDKQVEQAYNKRSRNMKATKKKKHAANGVGVAQARVGIGEQAKVLMERRKRWIETIGPVFDKDLAELPKGSIFENMGELEKAEQAAQQAEEE